jgi:NADH-quinone oxidoreductase subunit G
MVNATVNGTPIALPEGSKVIEAVFASDNYVPTLCGLEGISDIGACRVCVVEVEGIERLVPACNTPLEDGMVIHTDTPRVLESRRVNVSLLLSQHDVQCATCVRNGNCVLQDLAQELNILDVPYEKEPTFAPWDESFPLIRDSSKCVRCLRCVQVCHKVQGCDVWDIKNRATRLDVGVRDGLPIEQAGCTLCGQCITHCPTGALRARDDIDEVLEALADPNVVCTVQVAPAVRTSWGETLDLPAELATEGRLAATFRALGFDYVFDTNFGADMTIMEEGSELLERLGGQGTMPMFTSCCPGWVRYLKINHPDKLAHLSSAKSPQQMFGALLKEYVGPKLGMVPPRQGGHELADVREGAGLGIGVSTNPVGTGANDDASVAAAGETGAVASGPMDKRIFNVSCMPCVAKKYEAAVEEMVRETEPDVDAVLTVRELGRLIRLMHVNVAALDETPFDDPMNEGSGAAVIFGATGGVMEAALRWEYFLVNGTNPDPDAFVEVRGLDGWKEKSFDLGGREVRVAVASGLANAEKLLAAIDAGEVEYDFVEVMACPGGCAGGGGQPIHEAREMAGDRGQTLYALDRKRPTRFSHENPNVTTCYEEFLGEPLSHKAHELLHTDQEQWTL